MSNVYFALETWYATAQAAKQTKDRLKKAGFNFVVISNPEGPKYVEHLIRGGVLGLIITFVLAIWLSFQGLTTPGAVEYILAAITGGAAFTIWAKAAFDAQPSYARMTWKVTVQTTMGNTEEATRILHQYALK